jgi:hypothetical protein
MFNGGHESSARAKSFKIGKIVIPHWLVALILASTIGLAVFGQYLNVVNVPLQVKDPIEIVSGPSEWSLYPGQKTNFSVTVMNGAPLNYSAVLDFQASNLTYQTNYLTFSDDVYLIVPGQQTLQAWLYVAENAPAANVTVSITVERLPTTTPAGPNSLINGNFESGTFNGWSVTGACTIDNTTVHSGRFSAYISDLCLNSAIDQTLNIPANDSLKFTGWIYPTEVGLLDGYACSAALRFNFYYKVNMTKAFQVDYMWCGYPPLNTTNADLEILQTSSFTPYTWNCLSRNLTSDVLSYFNGINLSQFVLHDIMLYYHYSNDSPGSFYVDDLTLTATSPS